MKQIFSVVILVMALMAALSWSTTIESNSSLAALSATTNSNENVEKAEKQKPKKNMATLTTYLLLNGNCKPAMEFYKSVFGGELTMAKVGETAMKDAMPPTMHDKVINA
ncbi:MAG: hypothetical protein ABI977_32230, partial [Acidobacteriota bacterium]